MRIVHITALLLVGVCSAQQTDYVRQVQRKPAADPREFAFTRTNGTSATADLSASGAGKTISVTPCPLGVSGSDTNHYLYISGGTGTAEAVLITGGTCTSGAASGTIVVTTANTHTGAWTLNSSSAGIVEALNVYRDVLVTAGTYSIYATITPPTNSSIRCQGVRDTDTTATTNLQFVPTSTKFFNLVNDGFYIKGCALKQPGTATSGNYGIYIAGAGSNVVGAVANTGVLEDLVISGFYNNIYIAGGGGSIDLTRVSLWEAQHDGIIALGAQGYWNTVTSQKNVGNGFTINVCVLTPNCGANPFISGIQAFNNGGWGLYLVGQSHVAGSNNYFNNDYLGEVYLNASGEFTNFTIENYGVTVNFGTNNVAPGLHIASSSSNLSIGPGKVQVGQGNGVLHEAANIQFTDIKESSSGQGLQAGHTFGMKATGAGSWVNCQFSTAVQLNGASNSRITSSTFFGGTASVPTLEITGNAVHVALDHNRILNLTAGPSLECDAGSSLTEGGNITSPAPTNNCSISNATFPNTFAPMSLGATVASGGTIAATGQLFHINGTAAINTITLPANMGVGSCMYVIPDNTWTLTTAGNIGVTASAVVGKVMALCYDGSKLWPSY